MERNINAPKQVEVPVVQDEQAYAEAQAELNAQNGEGGTPPEIHLEGLEAYKDIVNKLKSKLLPLVKEGSMSESVANRIVDEFSYDAFKQAVKVEYR